MRLNQVTLSVRDLEAARYFYLQLGLTLIVNSPHYARFTCPEGDTTLSLILDANHQTNSSTIYFETDNLDAKVAELSQLGLKFSQLPEDKSYLWREALIHDPSGNAIKFFFAGENRKNPPWRVTINLEDLSSI